MCIDTSSNMIVVGHANGYIAVYTNPQLPDKIMAKNVSIVKPTKCWRAHIRPITSLRINPANVS